VKLNAAMEAADLVLLIALPSELALLVTISALTLHALGLKMSALHNSVLALQLETPSIYSNAGINHVQHRSILAQAELRALSLDKFFVKVFALIML